MITKKKRSVIPVYTLAAVWLFFAMFYDLYALSHYLTAGTLSIIAFVIASAIFPTREFTLPGAAAPAADQAAKAPPETPGDPQTQALLKERDRAIGEMQRLNLNIQDDAISAQIDTLAGLTTKIIDHVAAYPEKQPQIRKFLNYYLPTTIKLLNTYDRMGETGVSGEHISGTMKKIETMLDTVIASFEKQLDSLFANEAMDVSADITVMENLLAQEGLAGSKL